MLCVLASPHETNAGQRLQSRPAESHLSITGTSTIHDWHVQGSVIEGHLDLPASETHMPAWQAFQMPLSNAPIAQVSIPIASLASGKALMDRKMNEALKADAYPVVTFTMTAVSPAAGQTTPASDASYAVDAVGQLSIAGITKPLSIGLTVKPLDDTTLALDGSVQLDMTEFAIDPPTAMGRMIRTGKLVTVTVHWIIGARPAD